MNATATPNSHAPIMEQLQLFMERKNLNQSDIASKIGYSPAVISQLFKGEYKGDTAQVYRKIAAEIGYTAHHWPIYKTNNMESIFSLCNDAQEDGSLMITFGITGCGKTTAFKEYHRMTANCFYILANILMKPKDLLLTIAHELGIETTGTLAELLDTIVEKLESMRYPLLIIDDGGKLDQHPKCFGIIQLLYDRLKGRCGIVVGGTNHLSKYMKKMAAKDAMGFPELKRRVTYWLPLKETVQTKFIDTVCAQNGITLPSAVAYIKANSMNYGDVEELIRSYNKVKAQRGIDTDEQAQILASLKFNHVN